MGKTNLLFLLILILSVIYFSWLPSPRLSTSPLLPKWLSLWADTYYNIRTGVPFLGIGFLSTVKRKVDLQKAFLRTMTLSFILALGVEIGQLFIPLRTFDWADIFYALLGTAMGIMLGILWLKLKKAFFRA